jgi:ATP-dependent protease ClpP protease subunit
MPAEIYIYDEIGPKWLEMVSAEGVIASLAKHATERVTVRVNSIGGSANEAFAIYNALARHQPGVDVEIDGLAASAASMIAMAGSTIKMAANATMMIHEPEVTFRGRAEEMRKMAGVLDNYMDRIVELYEARAGNRVEPGAIRKWVEDETWMTAKEALSRGLVDEISQPLQAGKPLKVPMNLYRNTPSNLLDRAVAVTARSDDQRWAEIERMKLEIRRRSA